MWSYPKQPSSPTSLCGCLLGCWLWGQDGSLAQHELANSLFPCRTIDGVTYPGNVKEKEVAKKQYEKAVSQGKTAGLVK